MLIYVLLGTLWFTVGGTSYVIIVLTEGMKRLSWRPFGVALLGGGVTGLVAVICSLYACISYVGKSLKTKEK